MGADTTSTHLIFFIAGTVIAVTAAVALSGIVVTLSGKMEVKGRSMGDQLVTDIQIANDPSNVPDNPVVIWVKNTGTTTLNGTYVTLIFDGQVRTTTKLVEGQSPAADLTWRQGDVLKLTYSANVANSDHTVRVIAENGIWDDFKYSGG